MSYKAFTFLKNISFCVMSIYHNASRNILNMLSTFNFCHNEIYHILYRIIAATRVAFFFLQN